MNPDNRRKLADRVNKAAEASLAAKNYVSPIDVLAGIGWLDPAALKRWQQGQVDYLERVVQTNLSRISAAMKLFRSWAAAKGLVPKETLYIARTPRRQTLRFSKNGNPTIEQLYRTHWLSGELSERKRQRLAEKASRTPELVVIHPLNSLWTCHRCGGTANLLVMENPGPACLRCVGLDDLEFLSAGNALLTRRAKAKSVRHAVVVRFSKSRGRYERQGLLLEPQALAEVQRNLAQQGVMSVGKGKTDA
jgi:hypothetical protein